MIGPCRSTPTSRWRGHLSAIAYAYLGDWEEAEQRINRYKKLSPFDPHAFFYDTAFIIDRIC